MCEYELPGLLHWPLLWAQVALFKHSVVGVSEQEPQIRINYQNYCRLDIIVYLPKLNNKINAHQVNHKFIQIYD